MKFNKLYESVMAESKFDKKLYVFVLDDGEKFFDDIEIAITNKPDKFLKSIKADSSMVKYKKTFPEDYDTKKAVAEVEKKYFESIETVERSIIEGLKGKTVVITATEEDLGPDFPFKTGDKVKITKHLGSQGDVEEYEISDGKITAILTDDMFK